MGSGALISRRTLRISSAAAALIGLALSVIAIAQFLQGYDRWCYRPDTPESCTTDLLRRRTALLQTGLACLAGGAVLFGASLFARKK